MKGLSSVALSNLYTMGCTAVVDPRQAIPAPYTMPPEETRRLRARLILEEALETVSALGFTVSAPAPKDFKSDGHRLIRHVDDLYLAADLTPILEDIIDGCCDTQYVTVGTLMACGVPDEIHLDAVNDANNAKFPKGKAIANEHGKFQKPEGWQPPNHELVRKQHGEIDLAAVSRGLISFVAKTKGVDHHTSDPDFVPPEHREHGNKGSSAQDHYGIAIKTDLKEGTVEVVKAKPDKMVVKFDSRSDNLPRVGQSFVIPNSNGKRGKVIEQDPKKWEVTVELLDTESAGY